MEAIRPSLRPSQPRNSNGFSHSIWYNNWERVRELAESLVSLDAARIAGLVCRVAELNPVLGGVLDHRAGHFEYTVILRALQSCRSGALNEGALYKRQSHYPGG